MQVQRLSNHLNGRATSFKFRIQIQIHRQSIVEAVGERFQMTYEVARSTKRDKTQRWPAKQSRLGREGSNLPAMGLSFYLSRRAFVNIGSIICPLMAIFEADSEVKTRGAFSALNDPRQTTKGGKRFCRQIWLRSGCFKKTQRAHSGPAKDLR